MKLKKNQLIGLILIFISCDSNDIDNKELATSTIENTIDSSAINNIKIDLPSHDSGFIKTENINIPDKIKNGLSEKIESCESIDFNGDGLNDYICRAENGDKGVKNEYWFFSDFTFYKKRWVTSEGAYHRHFINLDEDPEPEYFEAELYCDGADYSLVDQNLKTKVDSLVLYFNPAIISDGKIYWGYPDDITDIITHKESNYYSLYCSLNHKVIREGNEEMDPIHQKQLPVIFFKGKHNDISMMDENIKELKFSKLNQIISTIYR
jgi:hypothetical protein